MRPLRGTGPREVPAVVRAPPREWESGSGSRQGGEARSPQRIEPLKREGEARQAHLGRRGSSTSSPRPNEKNRKKWTRWERSAPGHCGSAGLTYKARSPICTKECSECAVYLKASTELSRIETNPRQEAHFDVITGAEPRPRHLERKARCCPLPHSKQDSRTRQEKQDPHRGARERQRRPKHKPVGEKMNCKMYEDLKAPEHNQRLIKRPSQGRVASEAEAAWLQRTSACRRTVKVSS